MQNVVHVGQTKTETFRHVIAINFQFSFDLIDGFRVAFEQIGALFGFANIFANDAGADAQRVEEFEAQAFLFVERGDDVFVQLVKAGFGERFGISCAFRLQGRAGGNGENIGDKAEEFLDVFGNEGEDALQIGIVLKDIDFIDNDDDLLAPFANLAQEDAFALCKRAVGRGEEEDDIGARQEFLGDGFVVAFDGVGAGRIDDMDFAKKFDGRSDFVGDFID